MAFQMTCDVQIGDFIRVPVHSIVWRHSLYNICNTAEIEVPAIMWNKGHGYDKDNLPPAGKLPTRLTVEIGDKVSIYCGYDGSNTLRFQGFVSNVKLNRALLQISCEGYSYQLKNKDFKKSYKNPSLKQILKELIVGTDIVLSDDIQDTTFEGPVTFPNRGYDVLEYFKEKCLLTVYFSFNKLYVGLRYVPTRGNAKFKVDWNIINADTLIYNAPLASNQVVITGMKRDGGRLKAIAGKGAIIKKRIAAIVGEKLMQQIAHDLAKSSKPGLYSGEFTCFLVPYVEPFYSATIEDEDYADRTGDYYVTSVEGSFSPQGGRQRVGIGIQLTHTNNKQLNISLT